MPFSNAAASIYFARLDKRIHEALQQGDMPFLGLYLDFFQENDNAFFRRTLNAEEDVLASYLYGLEVWPAAFACHLTIHVAMGFGDDGGGAAVWPHVAKAITGDQNSPVVGAAGVKEKIWKIYRNACIELGLPVLSRLSGTGYMRDEFLHQAGVPLNFIERLVRRMAGYANQTGLAEEDDPEAVRLWRLGLVEKLNPPTIPVTVKRAVEYDDTGFYPRIFARLYRHPLVTQSPLEQAIVAALKTAESKGIRQFAVPRLCWRDEILGVELPPDAQKHWRISFVEQGSAEYDGHAQSRFIPLPVRLLQAVNIEEVQTSARYGYKLWPDKQNNRLLLFDAQGTLAGSGQLAHEIALEPGEYSVLSRFVPADMEQECWQVSDEPELYAFDLSLLPGEQRILQRGPAKLTIKTDSKPLLQWHGQHFQGAYGPRFFASDGLCLRAQLPEELQQQRHVVVFNPGNLGVPLEAAVDEDVDVSALCRQWQPGMTRLVVELRREGMQRPLLRSAIYLWNGLQNLRDQVHFIYDRKPLNLDERASENIKLSPHEITCKNVYTRLFHLVFNLSESKKCALAFFVPGIFLFIEEQTEKGVTERPLRKGSTLAISLASTALLKIYATEDGRLRLGNFSRQIQFSQCNSVKLPLSALSQNLSLDHTTLFFTENHSNIPQPLVKFVTPQHVQAFSASKHFNLYQIQFSLADTAEEFEIQATNLLSGEQKNITLVSNDPIGMNSRQPYACWLMTTEDQLPVVHSLLCDVHTWQAGAWLLNFQAKINGRWCALSNARQDDYACGFLLDDKQSFANPVDFILQFKELPESAALKLFKTTHRALLRCYALECWEQLDWVRRFWLALAERLRGILSKQNVLELIALSAEKPAEDASPSWIPLLSVGVDLAEVYAQPASCYDGLRDRHELFLRCLHVSSLFAQGITHLASQDNPFLYPTALLGFGNLPAIMGGAEPEGFNMNSYKQTLAGEDLSERLRLLNQEAWEPGPGEYLGALHYRYALEKLIEGYRTTLGADNLDGKAGNHWRRGQVLRLLGCLRNQNLCLNDIAQDVPAHLVMNQETFDLGLLNDALVSDEQEQYNFLLMIRGISLLAQVCRWEARQPGTLRTFLDATRQVLDGDSVAHHRALGYLLYIGEALFSFYLLLWEMVFTADYDKEK